MHCFWHICKQVAQTLRHSLWSKEQERAGKRGRWRRCVGLQPELGKGLLLPHLPFRYLVHIPWGLALWGTPWIHPACMCQTAIRSVGQKHFLCCGGCSVSHLTQVEDKLSSLSSPCLLSWVPGSWLSLWNNFTTDWLFGYLVPTSAGKIGACTFLPWGWDQREHMTSLRGESLRQGHHFKAPTQGTMTQLWERWKTFSLLQLGGKKTVVEFPS